MDRQIDRQVDRQRERERDRRREEDSIINIYLSLSIYITSESQVGDVEVPGAGYRIDSVREEGGEEGAGEEEGEEEVLDRQTDIQIDRQMGQIWMDGWGR